MVIDRFVCTLSVVCFLAAADAAGKPYQASATPVAPKQVLLVADPLTTARPVKGEADKRAKGGTFSAKGWRATSNGDQLVIELAEAHGFEGSVEIDLEVSDAEWLKATTCCGQDKIAFLSMFSNPKGCPHAEHGATNLDALWMIRTGGKPDKTPFFNNGFKMYWSARGGSGAEPGHYNEKLPAVFDKWSWRPGRNTIRVTWSNTTYRVATFVNDEKVFESPLWEFQVKPLRFIYIGRSGEFDTLVGPVFSNLRVSGPEKTTAPGVPVPDLIVTSPANGAVMEAPATVAIVATPLDERRRIKKVEFYAGNTKVGEDRSHPFSLNWGPVAKGFYTITARAIDANGSNMSAETKYVTVNDPP